MIWFVLGAFLIALVFSLIVELWQAWRCRVDGHGPFRVVEGGQQCQSCGRIDSF